MKKHILLITDSYPPEIRSASHLMLELAEELIARNYQVTVVTCWPQYNLDAKAPERISADQMEHGVRVLRMKHLPHHKVPFFIRGIAQLLLPCLFRHTIKKNIKEKIDTVMVYSPPLPLSFVGAWVKKTYGAKFILNIQDLFPQNAIDLGVLRNTWLITMFEAMERKSYSVADVVTVHSIGNKNMLMAKYPKISNKLAVLHNWVDIEAHQVTHPKKNFRELFQLSDKLIAVFAGVLGPSQNLTIVIEVAEQLQHVSDLCFLIVGDGSEKATLQNMAREKGLKNVVFKPFISRMEYPDLLHACDVGLVSLSSKNKTPVVPGKILGYMAAGLPIVAFLNRESDGHEIIQSAQCGYSVISDDLPNMVSTLEKIVHEKLQHQAFGEAGLCYVTQHFGKHQCVDLIETLFPS